MTIPHIDDIPELTHHLAKRNDPPILRFDRHGTAWEVVHCFGHHFKVLWCWHRAGLGDAQPE